MADFQLDTSGEVRVQNGVSIHGRAVRWSDLSPFTQGYVEAALSAAYDALFDAWWERSDSFTRERGFRPVFHMLAPETLAQMIADCEDFLADRPDYYREDASAGAAFWANRQNDGLGSFPAAWNSAEHAAKFRPLTLSLGDDGKVYALEVRAHA